MPGGSQARQRVGMSMWRERPPADTEMSASGQRMSGTFGPICTGIDTIAVPKSCWSRLSWSVTSTMTAAGPT